MLATRLGLARGEAHKARPRGRDRRDCQSTPLARPSSREDHVRTGDALAGAALEVRERLDVAEAGRLEGRSHLRWREDREAMLIADGGGHTVLRDRETVAMDPDGVVGVDLMCW